MRDSFVDGSPVGEQLRDAYRLHALQAAVHERELAEVVPALQAAGIEALIVKGWAAARLYAEPGLRPYGDIDVCVGPTRHRAAREALAASLPSVDVDLHRGLAVNSRMIADLPTFETAWGRARGPASRRPRSMCSHRKITLRFSPSTSSPTVRGARSGSVTSRPRSSACPTISTGSGASHAAPGSRRGSRSTVALAERLLGAQTKHAPTTRGRRHAGSSPPS